MKKILLKTVESDKSDKPDEPTIVDVIDNFPKYTVILGQIYEVIQSLPPGVRKMLRKVI